ncbi:STAS domain-containing protein [Thalassoroseus pseudoceratinae]|uniref:STAS domain-containing protein n=1 Tax=Thalassoroseus pseudoceratinae TaxID=2713176 RepID=UPI001421A047|nr:STAS domain-containing protein [Thalassoroseus pseudoceratinae]
MPNNDSIHVSRQDDITIITLGPEYQKLEEGHLQEVRTEILTAVESAEPPLVVLDMSNVNFFGSAFIEILFRAWNRLEKAENGKFVICGLMPYCKEVLQVTNLDRIWELVETRDDAIAQLQTA